MDRHTDILVIGASASGTCAAIQAGRMGASVILCEPCDWVGGMLTAAGVSAIDGNNLLPSGLWGEFQRAIHRHYGGARHVETGWVSNTLFDPRVGQGILRSWIDALPSVDLEPGWTCNEVIRRDGRVCGARFVSEAGEGGGTARTLTVHATVTIFADEYGDAVAAAEIPWRVGLESRAVTGEPQAPEQALAHPQDFTWCATIRSPPSGFAASCEGPTFAAGTEYGDILGDPPITWDRLLDYGRLPGDLVMLNWPTQDCYGDYLAPATRDSVTRAAREKTSRLIAALREAFGPDQVRLPRVYPGGAYALIPYIREARRIVAIDTLTTLDLTEPHRSLARSTSVAVGDYPLDHHRGNDPDAPSVEFPVVTAFSVPYGVLVPRDIDGVLVAEKSIGVTGLVNGCTRLQPVVMQIGQAAGAAAAICAAAGIEPREVSVSRLQGILLDAGVYLVAAADAAGSDPDFRALHWCGSRGLLDLRYVSGGWANRAYLDPDEPLSDEALALARSRAPTASAQPRGILKAIGEAREQIGAGGRPTRREFAGGLYAAGREH